MIEASERLLWTYAETAERLSMSEQALRDVVFKGHGPNFIRVGRRVFFRPNDISQWIDALAVRQGIT